MMSMAIILHLFSARDMEDEWAEKNESTNLTFRVKPLCVLLVVCFRMFWLTLKAKPCRER